MSDVAREKVRRLLEFLKEFQKRNHPPVRSIDEYEWTLSFDELPRHPAVTVGQISEITGEDNAGAIDGLILRVRRPDQKASPRPPAAIHDWLLPGWNDIESNAEFLPTKNVTIGNDTRTIRFEDDVNRVQARSEWLARRSEWIVAETPVREVGKCYEWLYELRGRLQKESEKYQLLIGDGLVRVADVVGRILHPVLLQRLELQFHPEVPEFCLVETDDPPELAMTLFSDLTSKDGTLLANSDQLGQCQQELAANRRIHPLGGDETKGFLARLVNGVFAKGRLCETQEEQSISEAEVTLRRSPLVFLAERTGSVTTAIEAAIRRIKSTDFQIPQVLVNLVGEADQTDVPQAPSLSAPPQKQRSDASVVCDLLLTRPANPEQEQVLRQLDQTGMVLVQGPPGTGKTHTIANLVGHALAQGKTILITSHAAKALRVVREKIVEELRPLCVSVLDTDASSREELKEAITAINQKLGSATQTQLNSAVVELKQARDEISRRLSEAEESLKNAIRDEYVDVIVGGEGKNPAEAARSLCEWHDEYSWLPGPLEAGVGLPLSLQEVSQLYASNATFQPVDEAELACRLPESDRIPSPQQFQATVLRMNQLRQAKLDRDGHVWNSASANRSRIEEVHAQLSDASKRLRDEPVWFRECVEAGFRGQAAINDWIGLVALIEETYQTSTQARSASLAQGIHELPTGWNRAQLVTAASELERHVRGGGGLGFFGLLGQADWSRLVNWTVNGRRLTSADDFAAVAKLAAVEPKRLDLIRRWEFQVSGLGVELPDEARELPEELLRQYINRIRDALRWFENVGNELERALSSLGIRWTDWLDRQPHQIGLQPTLARWLLALDSLVPFLHRRIQWLELQEIAKHLSSYADYLRAFLLGNQTAATAQRLLDAVTRCDSQDYALAFERLKTLRSLMDPFRQRRELLNRLRITAPAWADAIARRSSPHNRESAPGDVKRAWLYRQWTAELDRRADNDIDAFQREVNSLSEQLQEVTAHFVVASTWAMQRQHRHSPKLQQSLEGYLKTISTRGFENGVRSPALKAQAREQLKHARPAVPVWVMPLSRVVESFDFSASIFDLVIIDEASQCNIVGLLPLMLAKEIVVVGDNEQVSPVDAGQTGAQIQALINQHLQDIPNKQSYDGRTSLYDLARMCFGERVRLVEHFRCVPEIIQFSNDLCYRDIKPLRESQDVVTRPFLVAHRVVGGTARNKLNEVEAKEVASLLVAASQQPEYVGMTMGVISLVGGEQAEEIDLLLRRHLPETEYANRRVLCGSASEFQGDERHIMFLSMVDSSDGTPLRLRQDDLFKQRFNVAASRAQNQMWVVHSLNPATELKPGDLRLRLIQHAEDPSALTTQLVQANRRAQSEFERLVIRRLNARGYRLVAQWPVGAFSIDIVVVGENAKKVAIECDGDRFHTLANLEDDYRRQLMLERLGWRFIRIRSGRFFRDPDATMARVVERLAQLEVEPIGAVESDQPAKPIDTELKERVVRRAEELRREWEQQDAPDVSSTPKRRTRRWRRSSESSDAEPLPTQSATEPNQGTQRSLFDEPRNAAAADAQVPTADPLVAHPDTRKTTVRPATVFVDPKFPSTAAEKVFSAAILDLVRANPNRSDSEYAELLSLLLTSENVEKLLGQADVQAWRNLIQYAPAELRTPSEQPHWFQLRDALGEADAIVIGANGLTSGPKWSEVRSRLPAINTTLISLVTKVVQVVFDSKNLVGEERREAETIRTKLKTIVVMNN